MHACNLFHIPLCILATDISFLSLTSLWDVELLGVTGSLILGFDMKSLGLRSIKHGWTCCSLRFYLSTDCAYYGFIWFHSLFNGPENYGEQWNCCSSFRFLKQKLKALIELLCTDEKVPTELKKAIMQARMDKKLTQSQLAQVLLSHLQKKKVEKW